MTSGEEWKYRNGLAGLRGRGIAPPYPATITQPIGAILLTAPARDWALPQFYFHVMATYAILRAEGIDLGKADYVAHMFAYLRPGTMPSQ